jgi:hypothetical protein
MGKDRNVYENDGGNLEDEEQFMQDWRKYGPIGVLFDIIASICTPQSQQLLQRLQQEQADSLEFLLRCLCPRCQASRSS